MTEPFLSQGELEQAAFELLTCSSISRYVRQAKNEAARSRVFRTLQVQPQLAKRIITRIRELRRALVKRKQRDVPEIEMAVLLAGLSRTAFREVDELLVEIGLLETPVFSLLSALSRILRQERPTSISILLQEPPSPGARESDSYKNGSSDFTFPIPGFKRIPQSIKNIPTEMKEMWA